MLTMNTTVLNQYNKRVQSYMHQEWSLNQLVVTKCTTITLNIPVDHECYCKCKGNTPLKRVLLINGYECSTITLKNDMEVMCEGMAT